MEELNPLVAIQALHDDLRAVSELQLPALEKLCAELDAHVESFRQLLDKKTQNEASRAVLASGKIEVEGTKYEINGEFKEQATELADILSLDQVDAAQLLLAGQQQAQLLDRSPLVCAVISFHERRSYLVDSLRLVLKICCDVDVNDEARSLLQNFLGLVLEDADKKRVNGAAYTRRCQEAMLASEKWLNWLGEQVQKASTLGQSNLADFEEIVSFQQQQLTQQHESLGAVVSYLVRACHTGPEEFQAVLDQLRSLDKWNAVAVHYVPLLVAYASQCGSADGSSRQEESHAFFTRIVALRDNNAWPLRNLQAALTVWYLAEYNSWYFDTNDEKSSTSGNVEVEAKARLDALNQALRDGALQCTLSVCAQGRAQNWNDAARDGLVRTLLRDAPLLPVEPNSISAYFSDLVMESFETFSQSFITNMPDALRKFKLDEEDQRRQALADLSSEAPFDSGQDRHLERFFLIMSYAYKGRPLAASIFWEDPDSNLYGFLQWFSRRVSTPVMGAFCEMFSSISEGEDCAAAAHNFLLEQQVGSSSRLRRATSLSWAQIFEELDFYAAKVRESPSTALAPVSYVGKPKTIDPDEPETPVMLECYLRLTAHLCSQSAVVRTWVLNHPTVRLIDNTFVLCNSAVPSRVRACAFSCIQALSVSRTRELGFAVWSALDQWASSGFLAGQPIPRPTKPVNAAEWIEEVTFDAVTSDFDETAALVSLLQTLITPTSEEAELSDALTFPEQLGSSYRASGVEPYIDLVMGRVLGRSSRYEGSSQYFLLISQVLHFAEICLASFNQSLLLFAYKSGAKVDDEISCTSLQEYVRLHPFSRTIEWLFNTQVVTSLFRVAHQDINEVSIADADSAQVLALQASLRVMSLTLELQSTYWDIVRPVVKTQAAGQRRTVLNPATATFEDCIAANLRIVADLAYYSGSGHQDLAMISMELLKRICASKKLNSGTSRDTGSTPHSNRLVGVLQQNQDVDPVARSLIRSMRIHVSELELGPESPRFETKHAILDFLETTLNANPDTPGLAHLLLGFTCLPTSVQIAPDGLFARHESLFHAVLQLALEYPDGLSDCMLLWCLELKAKAFRIIEMLWSSPLTADLTLAEMEIGQIMAVQWLKAVKILPQTSWEGRCVADPDFLFTDAAPTLTKFLVQRQCLLAYASANLRFAAINGSRQQQAQVLSTVLGRTDVEGDVVANPSAFEMLDFVELNICGLGSPPALHFLEGTDFSLCADTATDTATCSRMDMKLLEQMLVLRRNDLLKSGKLADADALAKFDDEVRDILGYFNGLNNAEAVDWVRTATLQAWADLATLILTNEIFDVTGRTTLVLRMFQVVAPKLEVFVNSTGPEALVFARLAQVLFSQLCLCTGESVSGRTTSLARERLTQLFKLCLRAAMNPEADAMLRETYYGIIHQYLVSSSTTSADAGDMSAVKAAGDGLIDTIAEDAYEGNGTIKVTALLLLGSLTSLATRAQSQYMLESLSRTNFVAVLVEGLKDMPRELEETLSQDVAMLLASFKARLSLLLCISEDHAGAQQLLTAGLISALRASGLFAADPDVGLDIDNPEALQRFYELLRRVLQILVAVVLSCGSDNAPVLEQTRSFLAAHRALVVGLLKRQAKITGPGTTRTAAADRATTITLEETVELLVMLMSLTHFTEHEEQRETRSSRRRGGFT